MKAYTRKQFIKLTTATGAAFFLTACGANPENKKTEKTTRVSDTPVKTVNNSDLSVPLDLVDKNDERYNDLRQGFNKRIDKYPLLIAICSSTEEVAAAVAYGREKGLPISVKSGGHSMEGFSCNDGGLVINLSKMNKVEMLDGNMIKVGPGCKLSYLYDVILPKGRLLPAGSCGTVGVGGLTLGGGYGLFARKYGLTCDHLVEATMVDGNGNIHSTKNDEELLWALKGGGAGNFGVVTEMVFKTQAAPAKLQAHYFKARKLSAVRASAILQTWMELAPELPDACFSGFVLNGSTLNILITNYEPGNNTLQPLLDKLAAVVDEYRSSHVGDLGKMLRNYYGISKPLYFRNSSAGFFKNYQEISGYINMVFEKIVSTPGMIYQVNTMGGKIKDSGFEKLSSYPHRSCDFLSELQAYWGNPSQDKRLADVTSQILNITEQHGITRQYVNYCSLEFSNWENAYYMENYSRLQEVKRKYDPDNNIRHPQSVKV